MVRTSRLKRGPLLIGAAVVVFGCFSDARATVMTPAEVVRELYMMKDLRTAVDACEAEYKRYPLSDHPTLAADFDLDTARADFVATLLGQNRSDNPRGIVFVDLERAKKNRPGLAVGKSGTTIVDSFGRHYRIVMDADRDGRVSNPDRTNTDDRISSNAPEWLPTKVVVFSSGPDGIFNTGDDLTSWRGGPSWTRRWDGFHLPYHLMITILLLVLAAASWKLLRYYSRLRHGEL
jgi:hypothetical protein